MLYPTGLNEVNNDTLLMTLVKIREKRLELHSLDVRQRYELIFSELLRRKSVDKIPVWSYYLTMLGDLSYLTSIDWYYVNAMSQPITKEVII